MKTNGFDSAQQEYLRSRERGLLATVAPNGTPQCKPVGYRLDDDGEIEIAGYELERSAKFRNLELHPDVAFTVEDVPDASRGAEGVRFVEIRGWAHTTQLDAPPIEGLSRWVIRIRPRQQRHSRYEVVAARVVAPEVVLAQVRRTELDDDGEPIPSVEGAERFSEMALYAFVRRGQEWWLAAGQNTVVVSDRGAVRQS